MTDGRAADESDATEETSDADGAPAVIDGDDADSVVYHDRGNYDVLGVGLGPFNLGLAALLEGDDSDLELDAVFLEREAEFDWHEGMLIEGVTLEVPFLADLVTMADPTSSYSFLNYLRERDRIYEFYFYETFQIPRREYDAYLQWVAETVPTTRFSREVTRVEYVEAGDGSDAAGDDSDVTASGETAPASAGTFVVEAVDPETGQRYRYRADDLVMGVGSRPAVPEFAREYAAPDADERVFHTASYLGNREDLLEADSITVVGSGQSAAEVVLDLLERQSTRDYRLDWLTRSDGFFPMEYSKLGLQHFTPEYTRYFYDLPRSRKDDLLAGQGLLYKGIDVETSERIYDALYERSIGDREPDFGMLATTDVHDVARLDGRYWLECTQHQQGREFVLETDAVVFGTGYHRPTPTFLEPIVDRIAFDDRGRFRVREDYRLEGEFGAGDTSTDGTGAAGDATDATDDAGGRIFVQNAEVHTHGVGAPDLGLGCYRNAVIVSRLAGREVYPVDRDTVYQDFDVERFADHAPVRTDATQSLSLDTE